MTVTVRPLPVAHDDSYSVDQDTTLTVNAATGVLANDTSGTGAPLSAARVSGPAHGTLSLAADGSFSYAPDAGFFGTDAFTYTASDGANTSAPATVTITVKQVLAPVDPPQALDDGYSTDEGVALTVTAATGVLANDGGTRPLTAGSASDPANGTVALNADGSFTYTPDAGFTGPDTFTYAASNSAGSDTATVRITVKQVLPPVTPPQALDDTYATDQDTPLTANAATGVLANDTGTAPLTASAASNPADGTVTIAPTGPSPTRPTPASMGPDSFTYTATNSAGSDTATVTITVNEVAPPATAPTAVDDDYATDQDTPLTVPVATGVLANDTGTSPLTAGAASDPPNGTVTLNADGSFTYTPDAGFVGTDTFSYTATNAAGSDTATVTITVNAVAPPIVAPTAVGDSYATGEDTPLTATAATGVLANDTGSRPMTAGAASDPPNGSVTLNAAGSFTYTPDPGFSGTDTFTYTATNSAGSDTATVTITVQPAPPVVVAPTAVDDSYSAQFGTALPVPAATGVLANDGGTEPLTAGAASDPPNGNVTMNADGSFGYTPDAGFAGADSFTYEASNSAGSDTATVTITVGQRPNRPPSAGDDAFSTPQDTPLEITAADVLANDSDPDGDPLTFASPLPLTDPEHGTVTLSGGAAVYTPDAGFSGTDTLTYPISDGADNSAPATVTITVTPAAPPNPGGGSEIVINPGGGGTVPLPGGVAPPLRVCRIRVDVSVREHRVVRRVVLATGSVRTGGRRRAAVRITANPRGLQRLRNSVGGLPVTLRVICRTANGAVIGRAERRLALLRIAHTVTPPGSWVPDQAILTAGGERFVEALRRRLRRLNVSRLRCDGHTASVPGSRVDPVSLSRRRAQLVCGRLRQSSLRARPQIVAHGLSEPIATNASEAGRAANRRVEITIVYRRSTGASRARLGPGWMRPWVPPRLAPLPTTEPQHPGA